VSVEPAGNVTVRKSYRRSIQLRVDERGTRTCSFLCSCWVTPSPSLRVTCIRGRPTTRQDAQVAVRRLTGSDLCLYPSICMFRTARNQVGAVRAIRRHTCRLLVLFHTTVLHEHVAISQLQQPLFTHGPASARKESYICMESKCIVSPGLSLRLTRFTVPLIDRIENMSCMQRRAAVALSLMSVCVHGTELLACTCAARRRARRSGPFSLCLIAMRRALSCTHAHVARIDACQPMIRPSIHTVLMCCSARP
jgi:hypothetical protein